MKVLIGQLLFCFLFVLGCDGGPGYKEYKEAKATLSTKPSEAIVLYDRLIRVYPNSSFALKASLEMLEFCPKSKVCQENEISFLKHIIEKSQDQQQTLKALDRISEVYFERGFYKQSIESINRFFSKQESPAGQEHRLRLAKSNYYLKNFYQAEVELKTYIEKSIEEEKKVEGLTLKAEIQSAQKKYAQAIKTYEEIKNDHKELYFKKQIFLNEAIMYEEQKQLDFAILVLETAQERALDPGFVRAKIEKLKEQKQLMPGASGLKK